MFCRDEEGRLKLYELWVRCDEGELSRNKIYGFVAMNHAFVDIKVLRRDEAQVCHDKPLQIEDRNIISCGLVMAHFPKSINRGFRDKTMVRTLRGSDLEKRERRRGRLVSTLGRFGDPEGDD